MSNQLRRWCLALAGALAAIAGLTFLVPAGAAAKKDGDELTPVIQSVSSPPRWFKGDDGSFHVEYELILTNALAVDVDVTSLRVLGPGGRRVAGFRGARLESAMTLLGSTVPTTELPGSTAGVVWVDLEVSSRRRIPTRVKHRLTVDIGPGLPVGPVITDIGGRARVTRHRPVVIPPPLRGPNWVAVVGAHRRAMQPVNGRLRNGQRFAVDFGARLDDDDRTRVGDPSENTSYFNYGRPVLAVGPGRVVAAVDRFPDQVPNDPAPVGIEEADGNHVIIKLDRRVFAGYAHLKPGSVRVRDGERVRAGQVLGKLGNSGATTGPHLHFQIMTRASLLGADGLPFAFDRFELDGRVPSVEALLDADQAGAPVPIDRSVAGDFRRRGLTSLDVVSFRKR